MKWSEHKKYKYWKAKKYDVDDMTSDEREWFEKMENKYNQKPQMKNINKQMKKIIRKKGYIIKGGVAYPVVKKPIINRGRKTLDSLFGL